VVWTLYSLTADGGTDIEALDVRAGDAAAGTAHLRVGVSAVGPPEVVTSVQAATTLEVGEASRVAACRPRSRVVERVVALGERRERMRMQDLVDEGDVSGASDVAEAAVRRLLDLPTTYGTDRVTRAVEAAAARVRSHQAATRELEPYLRRRR